MLEVQGGIEEERIAPLRLAAPHRIDGEEQDMALTIRCIDDGRAVCQRLAARQLPADKQVLLVRKAQ